MQIGDGVSAGAYTRLHLEFVLGGRIGLNPNASIEITGERNAVDVGGPHIKLNHLAGYLWVKFTTVHEFMEIQNSGGVAGIRG